MVEVAAVVVVGEAVVAREEEVLLADQVGRAEAVVEALRAVVVVVVIEVMNLELVWALVELPEAVDPVLWEAQPDYLEVALVAVIEEVNIFEVA